MKRILITGKNSYVGNSLNKFLQNFPNQYEVDLNSFRNNEWKNVDFSKYDVIIHVSAIVHKKEKPEFEHLYFKINKQLSIEIAKKAKDAGVRQFIFMSTMAVYGKDGKVGEKLVITKETKPKPSTFYGRSKLEAEYELFKLSDESFKVLTLRPPMIYGPNCPGNYSKLQRIALKSPIFPMIENQRSMLNIDKLCISIKEYINTLAEGVYFPQDDNYVNTSMLVKKLAVKNNRNIYMSKSLGWFIKTFGRRFKVIKKVFGNLVYEK